MIDYKKTEKFWDDAAKGSSLNNKATVGMLTEGNEYNAIYRKREEEAHFLRIFQPVNTMRVLEVGTGGGRWAFFLSDRVSEVVGIDFSKNMINVAEQQKMELGIDNINFIHTDLLSFNDNKKFDLIYFSGVLQYINDTEALLSVKKAMSLLKPNGIIISRDTIQELKRQVLEGEYPVIFRTISEYEDIFNTADFRLDYCELSYKPRRFTAFSSRISKLPLMGYKSAFMIQKILIGINTLLGNPRFLMKKYHREMLREAGEREHRFFRYHVK